MLGGSPLCRLKNLQYIPYSTSLAQVLINIQMVSFLSDQKLF